MEVSNGIIWDGLIEFEDIFKAYNPNPTYQFTSCSLDLWTTSRSIGDPAGNFFVIKAINAVESPFTGAETWNTFQNTKKFYTGINEKRYSIKNDTHCNKNFWESCEISYDISSIC